MRTSRCLVSAVAVVVLGLSLGGCASGPNSLTPNPDKDLRKAHEQFAADAAKRTYPTTAPHAQDLPIRAEVDYQLHVINVVNLSNTPLTNVEVWVNHQYVCALSTLPARRQVGINFDVLYDKEGHMAPMKGVWVEQVEIYSNDTLIPVSLHPAD